MYITLAYPRNDIKGIGNLILIKASKRTTWWMSKCCWNIIFVFIAYFLSWLVIFIFSIIATINLSINILPNVGLLFHIYDQFILNDFEILILTFIMPLLVSITLSLLQMLLSQIMKPLYSFIIMISILLSSAYTLSPFLIGNYSMPLRSIYVTENGVHPIIGGFICISISIITVVLGRKLIQIQNFVNN